MLIDDGLNNKNTGNILVFLLTIIIFMWYNIIILNLYNNIMKKIVSFLLLLPFTLYSTYADYGDILYIKNSPSIVRQDANMNSQIIAELKKWYVVLEESKVWNRWTKVRLTDGNIWHILNFNLRLNKYNTYEVKWNYWTIWWMTLLRNWPTFEGNPIGLLLKWNKLKVINPNYFSNNWIKVQILNWNSWWKIWFLHKKSIYLHCDFDLWNSTLSKVFDLQENSNLIDTTYCARVALEWIASVKQEKEANQTNENLDSNDAGFTNLFWDLLEDDEENIELNSADENIDNTEDESDDDFLNLFWNLLEDDEENIWLNPGDENIDNIQEESDNDFLNLFWNLLDEEEIDLNSAGANPWNNNDWEEDFLELFWNLLNEEEIDLNSADTNLWNNNNWEDDFLELFWDLINEEDENLNSSEDNGWDNNWEDDFLKIFWDLINEEEVDLNTASNNSSDNEDDVLNFVEILNKLLK